MSPRFDAIGLVVENMATTLAFYRLVGLDIPEAADDEAHVELELDGGVRIMWDTIELVRSFSDWEPPIGGHRVGLAFLCVSPDEVDELHTRLVGAGYRSHLAPFDAFWGQRYATVFDPDQNPVDLFAQLS